MDKQKEIQFPLRNYFVFMFCSVLVSTSAIGLMTVFVLKHWFMVEVSFKTWLIIFSLVIILVGSLAMWYGSVHLTRPISELNESVKAISRGDFSRKIPLKHYPKDTAKYHNELAQLSQHVNQMAEDLRRSDEHRSAFIANLSHELKTPIASLVGISDLLADEKLDESTRKDLTGILRSESLRLSRLCDGIVTLTKMERDFEPKKKPLQLDEQIRHAVILITEKWKQKEIDLTFTSRPVHCVTDPDLSMQVWTNLLDNAVKYSADSVHLTIDIQEENDTARVTIADNGIGMSEEDQRHIFEQFYQVEHSHVQEGNGLGLTIVKKIVDQLGGSISFESEIGKGSTFQIILPKQ